MSQVTHPCPRCAAPLGALALADVAAAWCGACHGVFLPATALEHFATDAAARERAVAELPADEYQLDLQVRYLPCPLCAALMNRKMYGRLSRVVVEVCRKDGVWFDRGGLPTALRFVGSGGLEAAKKRDRDDAAEAARTKHADQVRETISRGLTSGGTLASEHGWFARGGRESDVAASLELLFELLK